MRFGARRVARRARQLACGILLSAFALPAASSAQGSCEVNNQASCFFGNTATFGINLTVTAAVRLATSTTDVSLATPTGTSFEAGFGAGTLLGLNTRANTNWVVTVNATTALWSAVGPLARADRPAADLQWATVVGGPYTDMTTSPVTLASGGATGGTGLDLYLRARYAWILDTPGDYSLPVQLTITAP
jgi:hypothetical protein